MLIYPAPGMIPRRRFYIPAEPGLPVEKEKTGRGKKKKRKSFSEKGTAYDRIYGSDQRIKSIRPLQ